MKDFKWILSKITLNQLITMNIIRMKVIGKRIIKLY